MPNLKKWIFNQKNLQFNTSKIDRNSIPGLESKFEILKSWAMLARTGEIKQKKETEMQGKFLFDIFNKVLGYSDFVTNPKIWNLNQEQSTAGGKFADGSLGFFSNTGLKPGADDIRVVIELKDANTNLDEKQHRQNDNRTPVEQAFSYVPQAGKKCNWVIVSNFLEIRLYHHKSISEYEIFEIAKLDNWEYFQRFWLLLSCENLIAPTGTSKVDSMYEKNEADEQQVSKELYAIYKKIRLNLFEHLKQHNKGKPELMLLEKTQKILDRFIFISFCEDNHLLPEKVFRKIIESGKNSFQKSDSKIWSELKGLFEAINQGSPPHNINKFNGGLFATDEELDSLEIRDNILEEMSKLAEYDFESDVDVNILGHIFEQSISDIEELKAGIENKDFDKSKSKRKKEGIFYTPEYITRYIVENAVGGWLEDRKTELGFYELPELTDADKDSILQRIKKPALKISYNAKKHLEFWEAYREKLRNIKVLDPACGSGAFLNQAFNFLYAEGLKVNEKITELSGGQHEIFQIDKHILTNNLYGVDLNQESVEITKLSLWIKTANKYSELTALDDNIKCGNSLIDDPVVAGEKAFNWFREFPAVFPGYRDYSPKYLVPDYEVKTIEEIRERRLQEPEAEYMGEPTNYEPMIIHEPSYSYKAGSKGFERHGFDVVIGNPPYVNIASLPIKQREFFQQNYNVTKNKTDLYAFFIERATVLLKTKIGYLSYIVPHTWLGTTSFQPLRELLLNKLKLRTLVKLDFGVFADAIVKPVILVANYQDSNNIFVYNERIELLIEIPKSIILKDRELKINIDWDNKKQTVIEKIFLNSASLNTIIKFSRGIKTSDDKRFIKPQRINDEYKKVIRGRNIKAYRIDYDGEYIWYRPDLMKEKVGCLPHTSSLFEVDEKLISQRVNSSGELLVTYDSEGFYCLDTTNVSTNENRDRTQKLKYLLVILNSKLINWWFNDTFKMPTISGYELNQIPVKKLMPEAQQPFIALADTMLDKNKELQEIKNRFTDMLKSEFSIEKLSIKLQNWIDISWAVFLAELKKLKIELSGVMKDDWFERFNRLGAKAREIKQIIDTTDKKIDRMVYELYGLTEEEIKIVEGGS